MSHRPVFAATIVLCLVIATIPGIAEATIMWEEDYREVCNESGTRNLPKKMTIRQVIDDTFFAEATDVAAVLFSSYLFRVDVDSGKVVANGVLIKPNSSEIPLPKLVGKMRDGDAEKSKLADATFERGDMIEWTVKLKGLAPLEGFDCWILVVGIAADDSLTAQSGLPSAASLHRSKKE